MSRKKPITKKDKILGLAARELAGVADSVRLPKTDKPQKVARSLSLQSSA